MKPRSALLVILALALSCVSALAAVAAQARPKIPPPDFTRESEEDAAGLKQWKKLDVDCPNCKGAKSYVCEHCKDYSNLEICRECDMTKRATCRTCAGKGKIPDPIVEMACPYCWGSTWYVCGLCNSFGYITVGEQRTACGACKEKGLLECVACAKKRRVDTVRIGKKNPGEATAKELQETLDKLQESMKLLEAYEPDKNPSKAMKDFVKTLEPVKRELKIAKDVQTMLDEVVKGLRSYGAGYQSYEENLMHQFLVFKDRTVFLLQHQIRAVEQSLERAKFNESKSTSK
jgi:hypothetical protein